MRAQSGSFGRPRQWRRRHEPPGLQSVAQQGQRMPERRHISPPRRRVVEADFFTLSRFMAARVRRRSLPLIQQRSRSLPGRGISNLPQPMSRRAHERVRGRQDASSRAAPTHSAVPDSPRVQGPPSPNPARCAAPTLIELAVKRRSSTSPSPSQGEGHSGCSPARCLSRSVAAPAPVLLCMPQHRAFTCGRASEHRSQECG